MAFIVNVRADQVQSCVAIVLAVLVADHLDLFIRRVDHPSTLNLAIPLWYGA